MLPVDVVVACNGKLVHVDAPVTVSVADSLQPTLALQTDIATHDQILLTSDGSQVESRMPLQHYELAEEPIYVFSRQWLHHKSDFDVLSSSAYDFNVENNPQAPSSLWKDRDASSSDRLGSLADMCTLLLMRREQVRLYVDGGGKRLQACVQCRLAVKRQLRSISALVNNAEHHYRLAEASVNSFLSAFDAQTKKVKNIKQNFECDLGRLAQIELHPQLRSFSRLTLLDCVSEGKLRQFFNRCMREHYQLCQLADVVRSQIERLKSDLNVSIASTHSGECGGELVQSMDRNISRAEELVSRSRVLLTEIDEDNSSLHGSLDKLSHSLHVRSGDIHKWGLELQGVCSMGELKIQHNEKEIMPDLVHIDAELEKIMDELGVSQSAAMELFHERLMAVSEIQSSTRSLRSRLLVYEESLKKSAQELTHLEVTHTMPKAYYAALAECCRRRRYSNTFFDMVSETAQRLVEVRNQEVERRMAFARSLGKFLPKDLLHGLNERPPHCDVQTRNLNEGLPDIYSLDDVDIPEEYLSASELKQILTSSGSDATSVYEHGLFRLKDSHPAHIESEAGSTTSDKGSLIVPAESPSSHPSSSTADELAKRVRILENANERLRTELASARSQESKANGAIVSAHELSSSGGSASLMMSTPSPGPAHLEPAEVESSTAEMKRHNHILLQHNHSLLQLCLQLQSELVTSKEQQVVDSSSCHNREEEYCFTIAELQEEIRSLSNQLQNSEDRLEAMQRQNLNQTLTVGEDLFSIFMQERERHSQRLTTVSEALADLEAQHEELTMNTAFLFQENKTLQEANQRLEEKIRHCIALNRFEVGSRVLFLRNSSGFYEALHLNARHYFLCDASLHSIEQGGHKGAKLLLGKVISCEQAEVLAYDANPYRLAEGTVFHRLAIELEEGVDLPC